MIDKWKREAQTESISNCKLCKVTPVPSSFGSPRRCAFDSLGAFNERNWNCVTANALRDLMEDGRHKLRNDRYRTRYADESIGMLAVPDEEDYDLAFFVIGTWYKDHGGIGQLSVMRDGMQPYPLTMAEAEMAITRLKWQGLAAT